MNFQVHIKDLAYAWTDPKLDPGPYVSVLEWYLEFEELLRIRNYDAVPQSRSLQSNGLQLELWEQVKALHRGMTGIAGEGCILEGMKEPLQVVPYGDLFLPMAGNQRLCVLRAEGFHESECECHGGLVPCHVWLG